MKLYTVNKEARNIEIICRFVNKNNKIFNIKVPLGRTFPHPVDKTIILQSHKCSNYIFYA